MITWADVVNIAPDLADVPASAQAAILADVAAQLANASAWPSPALHATACTYLAAHLGTMYARGATGAVGAVIGESVGSVSRQYAAPSPMGSDPTWDATPWGKAFRTLRRRCLGRLGAVT